MFETSVAARTDTAPSWVASAWERRVPSSTRVGITRAGVRVSADTRPSRALVRIVEPGRAVVSMTSVGPEVEASAAKG
jgi:hypothetical protein